MRLGSIQLTVMAGLMAGCSSSSKPFVSFGARPAPAPASTLATTQPVATADLGTVSNVPGVAPKPKPFIAVPKPLQSQSAKPSTVLLEHASPDSPVPLSDFANQPTYAIGQFHLRADLSAEEVERLMGPPAQLAGLEDPWLVYRLVGEREIWLHFTGPLKNRLEAADVIRGAEDGYVRNRVFSSDDSN